MTAEQSINPPGTRVQSSRHRHGRIWIIVAVIAAIASGVYVGARWHTTFERLLLLNAGHRSKATSGMGDAGSDVAKKQLWTCGMHPQVIQDHPGDCPICHMKLTPLATGDVSSSNAAMTTGDVGVKKDDRRVKYWHDPMMNPPYISDRPGKSPMGMDLEPVYESSETSTTIVIEPAIVQNMGVRTVVATRGALTQRVRAAAFLVEPESARTDVNLRVSGWIERLYADTDGIAVRKGEPLFDLYSPDLRLALEELIAARRADAPSFSHKTTDGDTPIQATTKALIAATETRLETLGLAPDQIEQLGALEHAPATVTFTSPIDGIVVEKANIFKGSSVMTGQRVLRLADRSTMWVEARVPAGMIWGVRIGQQASIGVDGLGSPEIRGEIIFIHPNVDEVTRTALVRIAVPNSQGLLRAGMYAVASINTDSVDEATIVPREAVIDTGESQLVFVSTGRGRFEPRRVVLGASGDDGLVQVVSGIEPGENVVASGQFLLDSESRLREAIAKFLERRGEPVIPSDSRRPSSVQPSMPPTISDSHASHAATAASAFESPATSTPSKTDSHVDRVIAEYLLIAKPLGEEQPDTAPAKVDTLIASLEELERHVEGVDAKRLTADAREAVGAMRSQPTEKQRDLFKQASASILSLVEAVPPSRGVAQSLYVANCPMAQADWLQDSQELANPFYGEDMKECGRIVRKLGDKPKGKGGHE